MRTIGIPGEWPLIIAFVILAAYTYQSGPACPGVDRVRQGHADLHRRDRRRDLHPDQARRLQGHLRRGRREVHEDADPAEPDGLLLADPQMLGYSTLALGSALALYLYPHAVTGLLATNSRDTVRKNMAALPAYSVVLALLALLGLMAIKAGITPLTGSNGKPDVNTVVPLLFDKMFPSWFAGIAFAPSASARSFRRRSCRSRPRTCSRATSTPST
jgi:SSS family solute:Na+ symporter